MKQKHRLITRKDREKEDYNQNQIMTVKVSQKGQIAIPTIIQKLIGIKKGDKLVILAKGNRILIEKDDYVISHLADDFKDIEAANEASLNKLWKNEPDDVWESYLK